LTNTPHVLERGPSRELITQNGFRWIIFDDTGYARIDSMPELEEAITIQQDLGDGYVSGYRKKFDSKMRRSRKRAKYLKARMKGKHVLDVGSNVGCFVAACHELGLDAQGVEINPTLVTEAQRLFPDCVFNQTPLEQYQETGNKFDGMYCSEVIEHVPDPFGFAQRLYDLLTDDGVLFLTTPALGEYVKSGKAHRDLGAPDHKLYFDKKNIIEFMKAAGFSKVRHRLSFGKGIQVICHK